MSQENIKQIRIQSRVDTIDNWKDINPVLLEREIGYEKETGKYKIGNGISGWNELPYSSVGNKGATIEQINDLISITNDKVAAVSNQLSQKADIEYVDNLFNSIIDGEEVYY